MVRFLKILPPFRLHSASATGGVSKETLLCTRIFEKSAFWSIIHWALYTCILRRIWVSNTKLAYFWYVYTALCSIMQRPRYHIFLFVQSSFTLRTVGGAGARASTFLFQVGCFGIIGPKNGGCGYLLTQLNRCTYIEVIHGPWYRHSFAMVLPWC